MFPLNTDFKDYFQILQVDVEAEKEVVQAAYYALMKKYHPDVSELPDTHIKTQAINEAYSVLSDEEKRKSYLAVYLENKKKSQTYFSQKSSLREYEKKLKEKEEMLNQKELQIKIKMRLLEELAVFTQNALQNQNIFEINEIPKQFLAANTTQEMKKVIEKIKLLGKEKVYVVKEIFKNKLSLEQEMFFLEWVIEEKIEDLFFLLEKAFKYKHLYMKLFQIIAQYKINQFQEKIALVVKNMDFFNTAENLLCQIITLYRLFFREEEQMELFLKIQAVLEKDSEKNALLLYFFLILQEKGWFIYFKKFFKNICKDKSRDKEIRKFLEDWV